MKIRVLGSSGGKSRGNNLPSFLVEDKILLDAGSVCSVLSLDKQLKIKAVFVSHPHFDHINDLPFLVDNFSISGRTLFVYGTRETVASLKKYVFNNSVWPDFSKIPSPENPSLKFEALEYFSEIVLGGLRIIPFPVIHIEGSSGFIVKRDKTAFAYTSDTYKSDGMWEIFEKFNVKTVITECSFPSSKGKLAKASRHFSTDYLKEELKKNKSVEKIFIFHTKPMYRDKIEKELSGLNIEFLNDNSEINI